MTSINFNHNIPPLRVLFLGTRCEFSAVVFAGLVQRATRASGSIEGAIDICAALVPGKDEHDGAYPRQRPTTNGVNELTLFDAHSPPDIFQLAEAQSVPIYEIGRLDDPKLARLIDLLAVDIVCVACYPKRVPQNLLDLPTIGFLNVHPSLLPAYRGPDPLFWIMRDGAQSSAGGVTIHWMDAEWDNGPIAAQQTLKIPGGTSGLAANRLCAEAGSLLLEGVLNQLAQQPRDQRDSSIIANLSQPQSPGGSYQSWPQKADYLLDLSWSAQRAFNFMRGTKAWRYPHVVQLDDTVDDTYVVLVDALAFDMKAELAVPFIRDSDKIRIQFSPGVLDASIM